MVVGVCHKQHGQAEMPVLKAVLMVLLAVLTVLVHPIIGLILEKQVPMMLYKPEKVLVK